MSAVWTQMEMARLEGESLNSDIATEKVAGRPGRPSGGGERSEFAVSEKMARPRGFEPLTPRFVVWCSIQLSYGRLRIYFVGRQAVVRTAGAT